MANKRTVGMAVVAVISFVLGGMIAIGNTIEVFRGTTFDGRVVDVTAGTLGLTGAFFAAILVVGAVGTWLVRPYGRTLSVTAAGGMVILNVLAVVLLSLPSSFLVVGAAYPVILLILFNLPTWKLAFGKSFKH